MAVKQKIVCHAKGDQCYGCAHYHGKADVCEYAEAAPCTVAVVPVEPTEEMIEAGRSAYEELVRLEVPDGYGLSCLFNEMAAAAPPSLYLSALRGLPQKIKDDLMPLKTSEYDRGYWAACIDCSNLIESALEKTP